jgi:hypothetical protein
MAAKSVNKRNNAVHKDYFIMKLLKIAKNNVVQIIIKIQNYAS